MITVVFIEKKKLIAKLNEMDIAILYKIYTQKCIFI